MILRKIALYLIFLQDLDIIIISNLLKSFISTIFIYFTFITYNYYNKHFFNNLRLSYKEIII